MSRAPGTWTASMQRAEDHPEMRRLFANGGGIGHEWLVEQIIKHCSIYQLADGVVSKADIKTMAAGKISRPTLRKYVDDLLECDALECVAENMFRCGIAVRICRLFVGRGHKGERNGKNSFTRQNADFSLQEARVSDLTMPSPVPDLEKNLSKRLKANAPASTQSAPSAESAIAPRVAAKSKALPPTAVSQAPESAAAAVLESQVAEQVGLPPRQNGNIADSVLRMGARFSNKSVQDFMALQPVDLARLDTEAVLQQSRQEAALLAGYAAAPRKPVKPPPSSELSPAAAPARHATSRVPCTAQRLPKSVIRHNLEQLSEAVGGFSYGEKEVNALRKWPLAEAQLVDLKNATLSRQRRGQLTTGVGAYFYGAVRRASSGALPTRR